MKVRSGKGVITVLILVIVLAIPAVLILHNGSVVVVEAAVDQDLFGWKLKDRVTWNGEWTKGDLGSEWKEGDWVSYVLVLNGYGGTVLPPFDIKYDFYISTKDGIFVDLLRNFHYMIRDPYPGGGEPNDITPLNYASYMTPFTPTIINRPFPEGTPDSQTNPPDFAFWRVTPNPVFSTPIPPGKSVVIYFEAHLAQSFIWTNGLEELYTNPPTNEWGGDRYAGWTAKHGGAGYTSGSNPQFRLSGSGVGQKTVPIPIPPLPTGQICGVKYHDLDANGVRDPGEPGLGGWTINLNAVIGGIPISQSTITQSDGSYCFTMLPEGTYTISEVLQEGWMQSAPKPIPPGTHVVNLGEGASVTGKDFGNYMTGSISGYKWEDIDGDGIWDLGESALAEWKITLTGPVNAWTLTNEYGYYEFTGLLPGTYTVSEELQVGWTQTYPPAPGTHTVVITSGADIQDKNFGNFKLGVKGGYKYEDKTGDGPSADDTPLQGWTINLYKDSVLIGTTTTDINGYYEFTGLTAGLYRVSEELPAGWTRTYPASGYYEFTVTSGFVDLDNNFGNFQNVEVTACKYEDITGDGLSSDDTPLAGWTVRLYKDNVLFDSKTTGSDGCYKWTNLGPGSYKVDELIPAGWIATSPTSHDFGTVTSGGTYSYTFTNFKLGKISGYKWNDLSKDGVWDAGEPALKDWTINLYKDSVLIGTTTTDINGYYEFTGLLPGTYTVSEELQVGWTQTYPPAPGTHTVVITSGADIQDKNFGNKELVKFLKEFTGSGALNGFTKPAILDPITSRIYEIKSGPRIWWEVTYTVENKDTEGHYYILWDKWGGNLMVLDAMPTAFDTTTSYLTLENSKTFKIDYTGYSGYIGSGLVLSPSQGSAVATLHLGDQQQGTNPGKGKGTSNDGKSYDVDIRWEIGWLDPGETATLKIYVAPGQNPGGQLQFSSWGTYVINTGPRVRAYADEMYNNKAFLYSWDFTNQLTVIAQPI